MNQRASGGTEEAKADFQFSNILLQSIIFARLNTSWEFKCLRHFVFLVSWLSSGVGVVGGGVSFIQTQLQINIRGQSISIPTTTIQVPLLTDANSCTVVGVERRDLAIVNFQLLLGQLKSVNDPWIKNQVSCQAACLLNGWMDGSSWAKRMNKWIWLRLRRGGAGYLFSGNSTITYQSIIRKEKP